MSDDHRTTKETADHEQLSPPVFESETLPADNGRHDEKAPPASDAPPTPITRELVEGSPPRPQPRFRWRTLLIIPLALAVVAAVYVPRQIAQKRALDELEKLNAVVRTQPVSLPGVQQLLGEDYAVEIQEVYLRNPAVTDADLSVLSGIGTLTKVELSGCPIGAEGVAHLADLPGLYTLHLSDTKVDDAALQHLTGLSGLGVLSLSNTGVTDRGLRALAAIASLERLFLDGTQITDAGLAHIGRLTELKELTLNHTQITDAGMKHLTALKNLEILKVTGTGVTPAGIAVLHEAVPQCHVLVPGPNE